MTTQEKFIDWLLDASKGKSQEICPVDWNQIDDFGDGTTIFFHTEED